MAAAEPSTIVDRWEVGWGGGWIEIEEKAAKKENVLKKWVNCWIFNLIAVHEEHKGVYSCFAFHLGALKLEKTV